MPYKPKKPCAYPGCPLLTNGRYCEEHTKVMAARYERYGRDRDSKKMYGAAWQAVRRQYAELHPFCEECYKRGILTPVEHVHHIIPLREGGSNAFENLMSLCHSCHSSLHARRGDSFRSLRRRGEGASKSP